jgi:hypothetical protein
MYTQGESALETNNMASLSPFALLVHSAGLRSCLRLPFTLPVGASSAGCLAVFCDDLSVRRHMTPGHVRIAVRAS